MSSSAASALQQSSGKGKIIGRIISHNLQVSPSAARKKKFIQKKVLAKLWVHVIFIFSINSIFDVSFLWLLALSATSSFTIKRCLFIASHGRFHSSSPFFAVRLVFRIASSSSAIIWLIHRFHSFPYSFLSLEGALIFRWNCHRAMVVCCEASETVWLSLVGASSRRRAAN